jgi:hypothetical protein
MSRFEACVRAIVDVFSEMAGLSSEDERRNAADFVLETHKRLPDHLRLGTSAATLLFDAAALPRHGRSFHRLPLGARQAQLRRWEKAPIGPMRSLIAYYSGLATLSAHSVPFERRTWSA